ncbi:MAG: hybrid sensor histidine kinase/response regulator [Deltaproteobacteria bacterium]|nr:hybrid sensor histidine kinase/response regulator [Deltaproteobacteria bacterium]
MTPDEVRKQLIGKFREVSGDRLEKIGLAVMALEKNPGDAGAADEIARELHTLKGEARMLGLPSVGSVAHSAEDLLRTLREGKTPLAKASDLLLRACDAISVLVDDTSLGTNPEAPQAKEVIGQITSVIGGAPPAEPTPPPPAAEPQTARPKSKPTKPGARPPSRPTAVARPPSKGDGRSESGDARPPSNRERESPGQRSSDKLQGERTADRSIRVAVDSLDQLGSLAGDLLVEGERSTLRVRELAALVQRFNRVSDKLVALAERVVHNSPDHVRELALHEGDMHLLRDDAFRFLRRNSDGLNAMRNALDQLADRVAEARLVPCSTVFGALPRGVRDLAKQQGKDVTFEIFNGDVGVDRGLLGEVRDALVHAVRNSVDHGIETPDERARAGKPRAGRIELRLRADGGMLAVDVDDDGAGIDPRRVRQAAVEKGLIARSAALALSDRDALELIFTPGFSTKTDITETSGRGVGMDVVKRKVEALGGSVSVTSQVGKGTRVSLRMPQSLALMKVLLVRLGDDVYGLPASDVESVGRIDPSDRLEVSGISAVRYRGRTVSLVALGPLLSLNGGPRHDRPQAVFVRHAEDRAALVVDGFVGEREVAVKPCGGDFLRGAKFIAGAAALEDGRIAVLLHLPDIMADVRRTSRPVQATTPARRLKVLLVDDSPIARATEAALVRALGHQVEEAVDGEEGYAKATAGNFDIILTDIQMPRLDGIALCRRLRAELSTQKTPVVVMSSLAAPEDKRRGLDAGADAYLVKGELSVEAVAQVIERLTG